MVSNKLLFEVHLGARSPSGVRWEKILRTDQKHKWTGRRMYALYRSGGRAVVLFVPTAPQLTKIRNRSGVVRIYSKQTASGLGMGSAL